MVNLNLRVPELQITSPLYESECPQLPDIVITALYNENESAIETQRRNIVNRELSGRYIPSQNSGFLSPTDVNSTVASSYNNPVNNDNQVNPVENTDQLYPVELYDLAESQQPQHLDFVNSFIQDRLNILDQGVPENKSNPSRCTSNCSLPSLVRSLKELTQCPVCYDSVYEFVQQCQYGHVVCHSCRSRLRKCPVCRANFAFDIRNLTLERIAKLI